MTTTPTRQPKALQLADRLKERIRQLNNSWNAAWNRSTEEFDLCAKSEDELRYQHAKIARLTAENEALRSAVSDAVAAERMACVVVCDQLQAPKSYTTDERSLWDVATMACTEAIRARGTP